MVAGAGCSYFLFFFSTPFSVSDLLQERTSDRFELLLQRHYWVLISVCQVPGCSAELYSAGLRDSSLHLNISSLLLPSMFHHTLPRSARGSSWILKLNTRAQGKKYALCSSWTLEHRCSRTDKYWSKTWRQLRHSTNITNFFC